VSVEARHGDAFICGSHAKAGSAGTNHVIKGSALYDCGENSPWDPTVEAPESASTSCSEIRKFDRVTVTFLSLHDGEPNDQ
jgi:hypothetical protein